MNRRPLPPISQWKGMNRVSSSSSGLQLVDWRLRYANRRYWRTEGTRSEQLRLRLIGRSPALQTLTPSIMVSRSKPKNFQQKQHTS
jgi:hypothetical protein